jgi:hypothetical protein
MTFFLDSAQFLPEIGVFKPADIFWDNFGTILGQFWDNFGTILGQFWDNFGTIWGHFWDNFFLLLQIEQADGLYTIIRGLRFSLCS